MGMNSSDVVAGQHGYATDYNKLRKDVRNGVTDIGVTTYGSTTTFNLDSYGFFTVTLTGNPTLAVSGGNVGQKFVIRLLQDGSGAHTVTWFSTIKWANGIVPTLTATASKADAFGFICTSSGNYDGFIIGQNI